MSIGQRTALNFDDVPHSGGTLVEIILITIMLCDLVLLKCLSYTTSVSHNLWRNELLNWQVCTHSGAFLVLLYYVQGFFIYNSKDVNLMSQNKRFCVCVYCRSYFMHEY